MPGIRLTPNFMLELIISRVSAFSDYFQTS